VACIGILSGHMPLGLKKTSKNLNPDDAFGAANLTQNLLNTKVYFMFPLQLHSPIETSLTLTLSDELARDRT